MKKAVFRRLIIAVMAFCLPLIPKSVCAQQEKGNEAATTQQKPVVAYRIEFNVREIEDGKRLNSRNYMMMADDGDWAKIRVGNRVPYQSPEKPIQYQDIAMNIDCRPHERDDSIALVIHVDFSSLAPETQTGPTLPPVFRTERTEVESIVKPGKPTLVASMDDVLSNRRYEIEVTATKVK
jgi:hypothetical protein